MSGMITREADYAIRAMVYLVESGSGHPLSTDILAHDLDIPYAFLRRIVLKLTAAGLLKSSRGKGGGVTLAREAGLITLLDALSAIDPDTVALNACIPNPASCARSRDCAVHQKLGTIQEVLNRKLSSITFAAMAKKNKQTKNRRTQHEHTGNETGAGFHGQGSSGRQLDG